MIKKTIFIICISIFLLSGRKTTAQSDTFHYVSDTTQAWTVPHCVTQVTVQLWGGGGASGNMYGPFDNYGYKAGGSGAYMTGVLSGLSTGDVLTLYVPSGGVYGANGQEQYFVNLPGYGGWPGGGQGGISEYAYGGGGGGYAGLAHNGTYYAIAGAGGGGGGYCCDTGEYGGGGGNPVGLPAGNYCCYTPAQGGSLSAGGAKSANIVYSCGITAGSYLQGGNGDGQGLYCSYEGNAGAGGGGGYYGGGGGSDYFFYDCGGGGGSSFPGSTFVSGSYTFTPTSNLAGTNGNNASNYPAPGGAPATIGYGGYNSNGGKGLIIITYAIGGSPLTIDTSIKAQPNCGLCNGSISATAHGGGGAYTYSWSPTGQTNATATGLCAGFYTVFVTDSCGDTASKGIELVSIPITVIDSAISNDACYGECTGSAVAIVGLATPPYTYTWAPSGGSNATATGLCAGNYTVTVKDNNGCTGTASVTITQPAAVTATISATNNALCYGGTGTATVTAGGGTSPYSYLWNPTLQTNATATGLLAGTYTVTVKDNNGCTATTAVSITQPTQLTATIGVVTHVLCYGGTGSATVTAGGGTPNYTYLWTPTTQTTAAATGLLAGVYTVTVTDHNGCTATADITITQPALLTATMGTVHNVLCNGGVGSATVNVAGGTLPYTYSWSPSGGTNATGTGLSAGSYTVTVTDHNACTASAAVTITQPLADLTAQITSATNISCHNGDNGSATVNASGGTSPYTYLWAPSGITSATANNLFAVSYTITVTDAHGCTTTATVTLTQPTQVTATISEPKLICKDSTGNLIVNANGGTPPYFYRWSTGATTSIATITPVFTNNYSVTVTDANGCTTTTDIILQYGPNFSVDVSGKEFICARDSTTLCATAIGALDGAFYTWEPSNNTNSCITIVPGLSSVFTITVVDGCGSTTSTTTEVHTVPSPDIKITADINQGCYPLCVQFKNGTTISQGGIGQYVWTFGNGDTSHAQNPIYCYKNSGQYSVSLTAVSDSGCSATLDKIAMISVYAHPDAAFTYSPQAPTVENPTIQFTDESIDMYGIAYWQWNFGDNSTTSKSTLQNPTHTYEDTGTYCANLIVMDVHGCMDTATNCLVMGPAYKLYIPTAFTPNGDGRDEVFKPVGNYIGNFEMYIFDRWGIQLFHTTDINEAWDGTVHGTICQEGTYVYKITVTDSEGNQHSYVGNVTLLK